jgi:ribosomal protein S18 acetylase RimI-like enzyme
MQAAPFSPAELRALQERAARAQPIEHTEYWSGWRYGRTRSGAWWRGSVIPHGEPADLLAQVEHAEATYAAWDMTVSFQISPGLCPGGLDALLESRGYRRSGPILLQCAASGDVPAPSRATPFDVRVDEAPTDAWLEALRGVHAHIDPDDERTRLERLDLPAAYASASLGAKVIAVGRAVADTGWTGLFALATLPEARGLGAGRDVLGALAAWSAARGTPNLYLQVEGDNEPALRLYAKAGFTTALTYHSRVQA